MFKKLRTTMVIVAQPLKNFLGLPHFRPYKGVSIFRR